jgi:hypothetical protein
VIILVQLKISLGVQHLGSLTGQRKTRVEVLLEELFPQKLVLTKEVEILGDFRAREDI